MFLEKTEREQTKQPYVFIEQVVQGYPSMPFTYPQTRDHQSPSYSGLLGEFLGSVTQITIQR